MSKWIRTAILLLICLWLLAALPSNTRANTYEEVQRETLENQAILTGKAEPGLEVLCRVYTHEEGQEILLYSSSFVVNEGGIYQVTVPLLVMGEQVVELKIEEDTYVYPYYRYPKQLGKELNEYYLNLYQVLRDEG